MDYEKKYKETIERARKLQENSNGMILKKWLWNIFPELQESEDEDEKIRKELIDIVAKSPITFAFEDKEKVLAWLEKQGSEPNWCHHKVDLSNCSEEYRKAYYDGWNNCNQQHSQCNAEQKSAEWKQENVEELSEFENAMIHIGYSFFGKRGGLDPNDTSSVKEQAQYLLELAQKPDWSEEDEKKRKRIMHRLSIDGTINNEDLADINEWLKSPRLQSHWKPSDEQMDALYTYIYNPQYFNSPDPRMELVESVYKDLKKLKEE